MQSEEIRQLLARFEALVRHFEGVECWLARELQHVLGYERWESFAGVLERARTACAGAGQVVGDHLREVTKMVRVGSGAERGIVDVAITRYGCYLLAQNGDPRKRAVQDHLLSCPQ